MDEEMDNQEYLNNKIFMNKIISKCHQLLYSHSISGKKAQADIMKILSIIALNNLIKNKENIENKYKNYLLDLRLILESEMIFVEWKKFIISISNIFPLIIDNYFHITDEYVLRDLIKILCDISINIQKDFPIICGDIYEYFLNYGGKGGGSKELGQFFTPRILINTYLNKCGLKELISSYENPKIYDCCCGSGGFLSRIYISNDIKPENIYRNDYEDDIYKIAQNSLTILTKLGNINLVKCNSLSSKNPYLMDEELKFDIIITNPPFATEITNMEDIRRIPNYKEIYPIEIKNGICMFIQMIIYKLKEGGICGIVLPDGKILNNLQFKKIRNYILKNARVLKIINDKEGLYENTKIKTKFLLFQKGDYDNYNYETEFYDIINKGNEVRFIGKSKFNDNYQFRYECIEEMNYNKDLDMKEFGELFEIIKGNIQSSKVIEEDGDGVMITSSKNKDYKRIKDWKIDGDNLFIGNIDNGRKFVISFYEGKCDYISTMSLCKLKEGVEINKKYVYYYLKSIREYLSENYLKGCANKSLELEKFKLLKVPLLSIEIQEKVVKYIDLMNKIIQDNKNKIEDIRKTNELYIELIINNNEFKTLGEICKIIKGNKIKSKLGNKEGLYPIYYCSILGCLYMDEYKYDGYGMIINKTNGIGKCMIYLGDKKYNVGENTIHFQGNTKELNLYIYHYLLHNLNLLENKFIGQNQKSICENDLKSIKIPIPSLEIQEKINGYLKPNLEIIDKLKKENEKNVDIIKSFMKNILL